MQALLFLHDLPSTLVDAIFMLGAGGAAALAFVLRSPLVHAPQTKDIRGVAIRTGGAITTALTLALCAVQTRGQMAEAQRLVQTEAHAIVSLAHRGALLRPVRAVSQ